MDIRVLRNFMKIAEYGSICKAAESLHISQPPLSRQLRALEDELGTELFERSSKGVKLTEKGRLLYNRAASLISYSDLIVSELTGDANIVRLGMTTSLVEYALDYVGKFKEKRQTHFEVTEKNTFELLTLLKNIMLDVVFIRTPFEADSQLKTVKLEDDYLVAVGTKEFWQGGADPEITFSQLVQTPVITIRRWKTLIDFAAEADSCSHLDYHFICDDNRTALAMAEAGLGVAVLPGSMMNGLANSHVVAKTIKNNAPLMSNIYIVFPAERKMEPAVQEFIDFILQSSDS